MSLETEIEITQEVAATEVENPVEQETAEASPQDDAAFLAGFKGVTDGTDDVEQSTEPEPEVAPEPEPEPVKLIAGYTEDELRDLLSKFQEVDRLKASEAKLFGTLGSMKQAIDAMRSQQPTATAKYSKEGFKRLSAEFPEMAEMLAEDLSGFSLPQQQAGLDISAVQNVINERIEVVKRDQETKLLGMVHKDWRHVVQEPEFQTWKGSLAPEAQDVLDNGWDAELIADGLTAFKEWKSKTAQSKVSKQSRLEAAVAPKTTARTAPVQTDDDAFSAGFNSVRGIK